MKRIKLIIEKNDGLLWGRVESEGWMPTPFGASVSEVIENLKELQEDYVKHEGKDDKTWNSLNWNEVTYDLR